MDFCLLTETELGQILALQKVPVTLWANDVGLLKNVEPVVIAPKSEIHLCRRQYPLKAEEGLTLV